MQLASILVLKNAAPEGGLVLFGLGMDNQVYCCANDSKDPSGWGPWTCIGGSLRTLHGALNANGDIELFGRGTEQDQGVWHAWQDAGSKTGWHEWISLGHPD